LSEVDIIKEIFTRFSCNDQEMLIQLRLGGFTLKPIF